MGQLAPAFVLSCIASSAVSANPKALVLTPSQSTTLSAALAEDAKGAIYSALVSMADAFSGFQRGHFSWATVKLYYACFYLSKAALARRGFCVFYFRSSPFYIEASPGVSPVQQKGNSHTVVTSLYKKHVVAGILNAQPINGIHAFDWIKDLREDVNYRDIRFSDPSVPTWFAEANKYGIRRVIGEYLDDLTLFAFDEAHASIALPLAALIEEVKSSLKFTGLGLSNSDVVSIKKFLVDKNGPVHHFTFL